MLRPKPIHSVQIRSVNTSLPIGTDKQMNITGIEMQKDFRCVDLCVRCDLCSDVLMQCVTFPLHHQSELLTFCIVHTFSPSRPTTSLKKLFFWTNLDIQKILSWNLKYFGSESKYFALEKLHLRHCTVETFYPPGWPVSLLVSHTCHAHGPSFLMGLSDLLWQVLPQDTVKGDVGWRRTPLDTESCSPHFPATVPPLKNTHKVLTDYFFCGRQENTWQKNVSL